MIRISRNGTTRNPVVVIGPLAFKWAKNDLGRECNLLERSLYRSSNAERRSMLCPALLVSRKGKLLIMRAATPTSEMMPLEEYLDLARRWDRLPGEPSDPFEPGERNWGWFKGRRVAIDYAINAHP